MRRFSGLHRVIASVVLIIGTATSAMVPIADSFAERAARGTTHIEAPGSQGCVPAHDELACDLCRVLRLALSGGASTDAFTTTTRSISTAPTVVTHHARPRLGGATSPRAPPLG